MNFIVLYKGFIAADIMSFIPLNFSLSEGEKKRDMAEEKSKSLVVLLFWEPSIFICVSMNDRFCLYPCDF